jgi:ketosteroid isomerase-like protein
LVVHSATTEEIDMGSNTKVISEAYEAFARQDIPGVLAAFDPGIAWHSPDTVPFGGTFKGHDEVVGFFSALPDTYQELDVKPRQFVEQGDTVVVIGDLVGKAANGSFDVPFAHVWTFQDGKATDFFEYFDTVKMNQAIG